MKLRRVMVQEFGAIRSADVTFGPGLNVLHGPNDLGKSTLAEAIRLVLLLPHTSSHREPYVPWTGGADPSVELEFETGPTDIWSVRKRFGKAGMSLLRWSKNGRDFEDVERARGVDKRLREILGWGIAEPGGVGAAKGLPRSFLATALLSTQADVAAVLRSSLSDDQVADAKERISAALQAVAQDPLFVGLLRETQRKRDEAFTATGARRSGKDSPFRAAADRVVACRKERDALQKLVDDSAGVEAELAELRRERDALADLHAEALATLEQARIAVARAAARAEADGKVGAARQQVARIAQLDETVRAFEADVARLRGELATATERADVARRSADEAAAALKLAEDAVRADDDAAGTVARQEAELREHAAARAEAEATARLEAARAAAELVAAELAAKRAWEAQQLEAETVAVSLGEAQGMLARARSELERCDLLERALAIKAARAVVDQQEARVARRAALAGKEATAVQELARLQKERAAIVVPPETELPALRKLATLLATARGALQVGLVVTVEPKRMLDIQATADGIPGRPVLSSSPTVIEAQAEVEIAVGDVAIVRVQGGTAEARESAAALERRWAAVAGPVLRAANVTDLEGLERRLAEARAVDQAAATVRSELERVRGELAGLADAEALLADARAKLAALGTVAVEESADERAIAQRRAKATKARDEATRTVAELDRTRATLAERAAGRKATWATAVAQRDAALAAFPDGVDAAIRDASSGLATAREGRAAATLELERQQADAAARAASVDARLAEARGRATSAKAALTSAEEGLASARTALATAEGKRDQARTTRDAEDADAARAALEAATAARDALPIPAEVVPLDPLERRAEAVGRELQGVERDILQKQGALQHVGGNVARERLRDAEEALRLAEQQERELEAEYDAWRLLLEQMQLADAAQASNLGQALAPAIASAFTSLTQRRYDGVRIDAQLQTEGVVVGSAVRAAERLSVGTREQLSTVYRLCLAEHLQSTLVLDDQLVQSDAPRMDWFRAILAEKARLFQIVVLTCRPSDYLGAGDAHVVDLAEAIRRR